MNIQDFNKNNRDSMVSRISEKKQLKEQYLEEAVTLEDLNSAYNAYKSVKEDPKASLEDVKKARSHMYYISRKYRQYRESLGHRDETVIEKKVDKVLTEDVEFNLDLIENYFDELEESELTLDESKEYKSYVKTHIRNVKNGFRWMRKNMPELFQKGFFNKENRELRKTIRNHDKSKWGRDEYKQYDVYDDYRHGRKTKEGEEYEKVKADYDRAWNHHQKANKHHWQYWIITKWDGSNEVLDMPYENIIEMICDWWTFSWKENDPKSIFKWYNENKNHMILSPKTRSKVEEILGKMKKKIDEMEKEGKDVLKEEIMVERQWPNLNDMTEKDMREEREKLQAEMETAKDDKYPSIVYASFESRIRELDAKLGECTKADLKLVETYSNRVHAAASGQSGESEEKAKSVKPVDRDEVQEYEGKDGSKQHIAFDKKGQGHLFMESRTEAEFDYQYGVPEQKKYPLYDKEHVISAIKLFGHVQPRFERELALAIIAKMRKYKIDFSIVGKDNRLYKYLPVKELKESLEKLQPKIITSEEPKKEDGPEIFLGGEKDLFENPVYAVDKDGVTSEVKNIKGNSMSRGEYNKAKEEGHIVQTRGKIEAFTPERNAKGNSKGHLTDSREGQKVGATYKTFYSDVKIPTTKSLKEDGHLSKDMSVEDIAKKHGVSIEELEKQVKMGIEVEHEHTSDDEEAKRIALDHLYEFPDYYTRLDKMEEEGEKALKESVLDPVQKERCKEIFDKEDKMLPEVKKQILDRFFEWKDGLKEKFTVDAVYLIGSSSGFQYTAASDVDITVVSHDYTDEIWDKVKDTMPNGNNLEGTEHPVNYFIRSDMDEKAAENIYDIQKDEWLKKTDKAIVDIHMPYIVEMARFFMNAFDLTLKEYERDKMDYIQLKELDPEKVEISEDEKSKALVDKLTELKADLDSIRMGNHILRGFLHEAYEKDDGIFEVHIKIEGGDDPRLSPNNLVYKLLEKYGYREKIDKTIKEAEEFLEKEASEDKKNF